METQKHSGITSNMPTPAGESIPEAAVKHPEAILKPITFLLDSVLKEYETEKDPALHCDDSLLILLYRLNT